MCVCAVQMKKAECVSESVQGCSVCEWEDAQLNVCKKKKEKNTLFHCAWLLHAYIGVRSIEIPSCTHMHTTPGTSMFIILPKRTIKISSVQCNL